ncbi:Pectinesterase inhibitor domain [Dillenia turbinata]|uniref:Pectinesterase inhibitor domain n=1 Tax=Dillenia turbinata TaxID=194707 RepID=A0AAN8VX24_9MAGN
MATSSNIIFSIVFLILLRFYTSLADISPHTLTSPGTACNLTLYPDDRKSILFGYGHGTINVNKTLPTFQADGIHTLLSAVLTNQQTCLDGLEAISLAKTITEDLRKQISDGSKLYSISLALYANSWVPKIKRSPPMHPKRKLIPFRRGYEPLNMSRQRRKLLQTSGGAIKLSQIVTVSQDGGVYQEYVTIPANKRCIMMIGDGISQTVITGNRTVSDGWTTYKSATFATRK